MGQLTLEQEINRIPEIPDHYIEGEPDAYVDDWKAGMEEGAKWQKEQYREIINALKELVECDYTSGTHLSCALIRGKNALRTINESFQD